MEWVRGGPKTSQYLVWPPFASHSATQLLRIELIRLLIVACGMLVHSSSMVVRSCWILEGTGTRCHIRRSRASQTCSMGDMSVSMLAMQELGCGSTMLTSANRLLQQLTGWLFSDDLGGEDAGCGGPGLVWLHMVCGCEPGLIYCQILWKMAYGREMNIKFTGNSSGGHSCSQLAYSTLPQNLRHLWQLCCVIKLHILEWLFIVASLRHTCAIIMLSNQCLDMPHLWGGWIISAKEMCSLTQIWTDLLTISERNRPFVYIQKILDLWVQLMKNGGKNKSVAFIILFSVCVYIHI